MSRSIQIKTYANPNGVEDIIESGSRSCSFVGGNLVISRAKKHFVARYSAEVEFIAAVLGICKLLLVEELKTISKKPIKLYHDHKGNY